MRRAEVRGKCGLLPALLGLRSDRVRRACLPAPLFLLLSLVVPVFAFKLNVPKVLLPFSRELWVPFELEGGGCYSCQYELVDAELRIICSLLVVTGHLLHCDVIVDMINSVEIISTELCVDNSPLELAVRALNVEGVTCELSSPAIIPNGLEVKTATVRAVQLGQSNLVFVHESQDLKDGIIGIKAELVSVLLQDAFEAYFPTPVSHEQEMNIYLSIKVSSLCSLEIYDLCLGFLGPVTAYLHVSDMHELEVDLTDKLEIGKSLVVTTRILGFQQLPLWSKYFKYVKLKLQAASPIISLMTEMFFHLPLPMSLCYHTDLVAQSISFLLTEELIPSHFLDILDGILPLGALCVLYLGLWISQSSSLNSTVVTTCLLNSSCLSSLLVIVQEMKGEVMVRCLRRQVEEVGEYSELYVLRAVAIGQTTVAMAWDKMGRFTSAPRKVEVFPPFKLIPKKITLIPHHMMQVSIISSEQIRIFHSPSPVASFPP
ncbi:LOW QUALITY PROTEIN: nuclear pore membrane glycoprotein 210-like [Spheniscus humboldti]